MINKRRRQDLKVKKTWGNYTRGSENIEETLIDNSFITEDGIICDRALTIIIMCS